MDEEVLKKAEAEKQKAAEEAVRAAQTETDPVRLQEHLKNLSAALGEERKSRKEATAKLAEIEARDKARSDEEEQKKLKAKGEFEKAQEIDKARIAELEKTVASLQPVADEYVAFQKKQIDESLGRITDETDRKLVASLIEGKSNAEVLELLPKLSEKFSAPAAGGKPASGVPAGGAVHGQNAFEAAKEQKSVKDLISNAPALS